MKYHQGLFKPRNPSKYQGDYTKIIYRSSWEQKYMRWCDQNADILSWSSEELAIPYFNEMDQKWHRYFVDFKIDKKNRDDSVITYLIEIKPRGQINKPQLRKTKTKKYIQECETWVVNQTKWVFADKYAKERGWQFAVIDEYILGIKKDK